MVIIQSKELDQVLNIMGSFSFPWFIVGGWALDLALGEQTRPHQDVDLCCFREHARKLIHFFTDWDKQVAIPEENRLVTIQDEEDWLPPRHELHFQKGNQSIEVLLIDREDNAVLFRREPSIRLPMEEFFRIDPLGRPYVAPSWQLLFKAKNPRSKDVDDFLLHAPMLSKREKQWLLVALRIHQPTTTWIRKLEDMLVKKT